MSWVTFTALGYVVGANLPQVLQESMTVALYAMFIGLLVPSMKGSAKVVYLAAIAAGLNTIFTFTGALSTGWSIVIATLISSVLVEVIEGMKRGIGKMSNEVLWLIIGMGLVTYLPRVAPFLLFKGKELPIFVQSVLKNVPYATLGALIFPGVLLIGESIWYGLLGAAIAFIVAYIGANVVFVVLSAIIVLSGYSLFIS